MVLQTEDEVSFAHDQLKHARDKHKSAILRAHTTKGRLMEAMNSLERVASEYDSVVRDLMLAEGEIGKWRNILTSNNEGAYSIQHRPCNAPLTVSESDPFDAHFTR